MGIVVRDVRSKLKVTLINVTWHQGF